MKMDFPHLAEQCPADRSRMRFATLIARAVRRQMDRSSHISGTGSTGIPLADSDPVNARIAYFAATRNMKAALGGGAFLPDRGVFGLHEQEGEAGVNPSPSVIGKPTFLGSHYPGHPEQLRGMENRGSYD